MIAIATGPPRRNILRRSETESHSHLPRDLPQVRSLPLSILDRTSAFRTVRFNGQAPFQSQDPQARDRKKRMAG